MDVVLEIVCVVLTIYWFILFVRIILSWFPPPASGVGRSIFEIVFQMTEPVLGLVRGLLPAVRMGAMGMDLSPILIFIALGILQQVLGCGFGF